MSVTRDEVLKMQEIAEKAGLKTRRVMAPEGDWSLRVWWPGGTAVRCDATRDVDKVIKAGRPTRRRSR